jgi:hypothetical protein
MKAGDKRQIRVPADLAYGVAGVPPLVPPNCRLIFDIDSWKFSEPLRVHEDISAERTKFKAGLRTMFNIEQRDSPRRPKIDAVRLGAPQGPDKSTIGKRMADTGDVGMPLRDRALS